ncbi:MAG: isocitrate lyase/phosphoenolpyruvate mutase family protein [Gemmataceae bacterium]
MPAPTPSPGKRLRDAWAAAPIAIPGAFNPLVAKLAERIGFQAVYLSGGALSAGNGVPDIGLLTLTEFVQHAQLTAQATSLPVLCDADTGFGESLNVERTVRLFEAAGVAGIHLEDQEMPKRCGHLSGKSIVPPEVMAAKISPRSRPVAIRTSSSSPAPMPAASPTSTTPWTGPSSISMPVPTRSSPRRCRTRTSPPASRRPCRARCSRT